MINIPILSEHQWLEKIKSNPNPFFKDYFAFYSSWHGGIINDPRLMLLPLDDHMVHRGDGVFETIKAVGRTVYQLDEHLERLFISAEKIALASPFDKAQMQNVLLETLRAANQNDALIRLFLSRGPGSYSANPYDAIAPQVYIVIIKLSEPSADKYEHGVRIGKSDIPSKPGWMAQVKSCNYLPNVLMKKEAIDRGFDFVIGFDDENHITESSTENIMLVDQRGILVHPPLNYILKGTTMVRTCELAREQGITVEAKPISKDDLCSAREAMITGTSLNVLPVSTYENHPIGTGKPGEVATLLNKCMLQDIASGVRSTAY